MLLLLLLLLPLLLPLQLFKCIEEVLQVGI